MMPWTIYRYTLRELLKLLAASATVLVLVIGIAAAIKPLSEGLLGPGALVKYVFYLAPTMLGFAMPFAGAFAGTLVFVRMATDNELVVCRASGMSYRTVLLPVAGLGLLVMVGMLFLSNWVVPSFYKRASGMLEQDLTHLLVSQVRLGRPVTLGDVVLYADQVDDTRQPPVIAGSAVQPSKLIMLRGVAAGRLDEQGRLRRDCTAEAADLLLYRAGGQSWVTMRLQNVMYYDAVRGDLLFVEQWVVPQVPVPSPFKGNLRFLSWPQLRALAEEPEGYEPIAKQKRLLAAQVASERLLRLLEAGLASREGVGSVELVGVGEGERYVLRAAGVRRAGSRLELVGAAGGPVRVEYRSGGVAQREVEAERGVLWVDAVEPEMEPKVHVELEGVRISDTRQAGRVSEQARFVLPSASWPEPVLGPLGTMDSEGLLRLVNREYRDAGEVEQAAARLGVQVRQLFTRVVTQLHERAALAVAGMLVLMLSAVVGMSKRGSMPLVAYFRTFVAAVIVVVITYGGQNLANDPDASRAGGLALMWSGNLLLAVAVAVTYCRLARN